MNSRAIFSKRRGFALTELAIVLGVVGVAVACMALASARSRAHGQFSGSLANLKQIGAWIAAYPDDHGGLLPGFSWTRTNHPTTFNDLRFPQSDIEAAHYQAVDILRRRSSNPQFPTQGSWIAHLVYSHLALIDHVGLRLPAEAFVSPADRTRLGWIANPNSVPNSIPSPVRYRWPFSSTYEWNTALYFPGQTVDGGSLIAVSSNSWQYNPGSQNMAPLGRQPLSRLRYPSHKVLLSDQVQRHFGREVYFLFAEARVCMLMGDGSADVRRSGDSDVGAYTTVAGSRTPALIDYTPALWEPPAPAGQGGAYQPARSRFTHRLLGGRDYGKALP